MGDRAVRASGSMGVALLTALVVSAASGCGTDADDKASQAVDAGVKDGLIDGAVDTWVQPPPAPIEVAVGSAHVCARIDDGSVACWGSNAKGQLGIGATPSGGPADLHPTPESLGAVGKMSALHAAWSQTCARTQEGNWRCWGHNDKGQLGNGKDQVVYGVDQLAAEIKPDDVPALNGVQFLAMGKQHGCTIKSDKRVWCWGANTDGQLGNNKPTDSRTPDFVKMAAGAVAVTAGEAHSCAVMKDGQVWCWGRGEAGQLGSGAKVSAPSPQLVKGLDDAEKLVAGRAHTCALRKGGSVSCWGEGAKGQLGAGASEASASALEVTGLGGVTALVAGADHTCALLETGGLRCWGDNVSGQLGVTGVDHAAAPVAVAGLKGVISLDAGGGTTCAIAGQAQVLCWGDNGAGQLGTEAKAASSASPLVVKWPEPPPPVRDAGGHKDAVTGGKG